MKAITNARIVLEDGILENASLIFDEKIRAIGTALSLDGCEVTDAQGQYLFPGLIDLHIHGYCGREVLEGTREAQMHMAASLPKDGVTGYLATLGTASLDRVARSLSAVRDCMGSRGGAKLHGAYMEGVFISQEKRGAHDPSLILPPDPTFLEPFLNVLRIVIAAPEQSPAFISWCVEHGLVCTMGHTNARYEEAEAGIRLGMSQATHLFNGMSGINHRAPGTAGAALLHDGVRVELIADTVHVSGALHKLVYRLKGPDNILLVTDSSVASGMGPGTYISNNRTIHVDEFVGRLENGTISGSAVPLRRDVLNFHRNSGAPLYEAVRAASLNPARVLKLDGELGSLRTGKCADMFLADGEMNVSRTFVDGNCIYRRPQTC